MTAFGPKLVKALDACDLTRHQLSRIFRVIRNTREKIAEIAPGPKTQHLSLNIVLYVAENNLVEKNISISDIYFLHLTSKSTIVSSINRLKNAGVLEIRTAENDKRRKIVTLNEDILCNIIIVFEFMSKEIGNIIR